MENNQASPDPQTKPNLWEILQLASLRCGRTTTIEECQAVCKQLVQDGVLRTRTIQAAQAGSLCWIIAIEAMFERYLKGHTQAVGRQKTSLPLGRHKVAEIHLTEELAQLAMPLEQSGDEYNRILAEFEEPSPVKSAYDGVPMTPAANPYWVAKPQSEIPQLTIQSLTEAMEKLSTCPKKAYFQYEVLQKEK